MRREGAGKFYPFLSNLGSIDPQKLPCGDLDVASAFLAGPVMFAAAFMLASSSFRDAMTVTVGYSRRATPEGAVDRFLRILDEELPAKPRPVR